MKYKVSKEALDNTRKEECRKFIFRKTNDLNAAQSSQFCSPEIPRTHVEPSTRRYD